MELPTDHPDYAALLLLLLGNVPGPLRSRLDTSVKMATVVENCARAITTGEIPLDLARAMVVHELLTNGHKLLERLFMNT